MNRPRDAVIADHVAAAMRHTRLSMETYAQTVADLYHERTPLELRGVRFHEVGRADPYRDMRKNAQIVRRYLAGELCRMPTELEEALVLALPDPFQAACLRELASRYGLLAAAMPGTVGDEQVRQVADLMRSAAESIDALAPMLDDGLIDTDDADHAPAALDLLEQLQGRVVTLTALIRARAIPANNIHTMRRTA